MSDIQHLSTIADAHTFFGLKTPRHPLVSLIWAQDFPDFNDFSGMRFTANFYSVSFKHGVTGSMGYGLNHYDFNNGTLVFTKPNQVIAIEEKEVSEDSKGWMLSFHPDLIRKSALGSLMNQYSFFDYEVHEALHLSEEEQVTITGVVTKIEREYEQPIDAHSQKLIVSNIELLLNYCTRYYDRQFYVRTNLNKDYVSEFEQFLTSYFNSNKPQTLGVPSVKYCGEAMNMSPNYLSDLLRKETGKGAKEHITSFVVHTAKNQLLGTNESISEIAYQLGFEYPQHFSKFFKRKTGLSPAQYRMQN